MLFKAGSPLGKYGTLVKHHPCTTSQYPMFFKVLLPKAGLNNIPSLLIDGPKVQRLFQGLSSMIMRQISKLMIFYYGSQGLQGTLALLNRPPLKVLNTGTIEIIAWELLYDIHWSV
jgi:hypothetical protein